MLSIDRLSLRIGAAEILRDVSFDIGAGEVFGLVGESGSGKSMTALAAMGLLPRGAAPSGRVAFEGRQILAAKERAMCALRGREIGMIFQEPMTALNPLKTIGDQVAETLLVHGAAGRFEARRVAEARLDRVGLGAVGAERFPHELSGGQRQRVCIALAVALRPKLLIADEPTTALDVTTQAQILDLLKGLVDEDGMALWLITHDLAVVADVADHVAVMRDGALVEAGRTEAVFRAPKAAYTRKLMADSTHVPDRKAGAQSAPILEVSGAVRDYPAGRAGLFGPRKSFRAVDGVSLTVRAGESVGLVGESGCGKSTLTRAILGLDALQGGEIRLDGERIAAPAVPPPLRAKMQVVFQDPFGSFNPRHKVARLVAEPFHLTPVPDIGARVAEALEAVGLAPGDAEKYIHEFSGGQRQRIAIARAIVIRPKLVVLDEAVSALDVSIRARILDLLAELQARFGLSYLFISHDLSVVRAVTDRVLVMQAGRIVEEGATEQVFGAPAHAYTRALIAAAPRIPEGWLAA
ncbi:Peptide/opine/nickel uptake family ABC transporter, ATP-binding protein [Candidatus Rhodobacter oscarellae]|uniref:Peptide/opine/nickel uptake family ABC transporter, ATP-binding protein n=1 Tax=Candidatus Rhodobacter oscarellae TaxID=1675527 RepID=A0A0J9E2C1_9RHOB|nr:dipeptide ABC transporter ATP-binding protein [Candidatus Rhodobacter lobularis]KMW56837.1 Peptide/opine/nickel uptake family ABC transporter, ATP-binding protein [Candidatus Rhodobacter lobularis]